MLDSTTISTRIGNYRPRIHDFFSRIDSCGLIPSQLVRIKVITMKDVVNCGILGAGWWATTAHLPALNAHQNARVVALQKRDRERARKVADDFGIEHAVTSVDEMLEIEGLDAVVVSSTPNMHYIEAKNCLQRGLHVLVEKPMTLTSAEAEELVSLAKERDLRFLISCPWHYTEHSQVARNRIQSGELGEVKMISMLFTNFSGPLYRGKIWKEIFEEGGDEKYSEPYLTPGIQSYSDPEISGGGQIYCQVSHAAAFLGFLTASDPVEVFARFDNAEADVDVYDTLCLKLENGCLVTLASTGDTMLSKRHFEIRVYGTEGMLIQELWEGNMEIHPKKGEVEDFPQLDAELSYPLHEPARNLVDSILGQDANNSPAELGLYAMKIIEASCESAGSGENVSLV